MSKQINLKFKGTFIALIMSGVFNVGSSFAGANHTINFVNNTLQQVSIGGPVYVANRYGNKNVGRSSGFCMVNWNIPSNENIVTIQPGEVYKIVVEDKNSGSCDGGAKTNTWYLHGVGGDLRIFTAFLNWTHGVNDNKWKTAISICDESDISKGINRRTSGGKEYYPCGSQSYDEAQKKALDASGWGPNEYTSESNFTSPLWTLDNGSANNPSSEFTISIRQIADQILDGKPTHGYSAKNESKKGDEAVVNKQGGFAFK